jgi:putative acetyltransferase
VLPVIALFQKSVLRATVRDYDERQREVWAAQGSDPSRWKQRIDNQYFLLVERPEGLVGIGSITPRGHLDVLYVHYAYQGQGIATRLLAALEAWAVGQEVPVITTDASHTARPFFGRHGYQTVAEQQNKIAGEILVNYRMQKNL